VLAVKEYSGSDGIAPLILNSSSCPCRLATGVIARLGTEMDAGWASEQVENQAQNILLYTVAVQLYPLFCMS